MQVSEVKTNLNQIGLDIGVIHEMVSGLVSYHSFINSNLSNIIKTMLTYLSNCFYMVNLQEGKIELLESKQVKFMILYLSISMYIKELSSRNDALFLFSYMKCRISLIRGCGISAKRLEILKMVTVQKLFRSAAFLTSFLTFRL